MTDPIGQCGALDLHTFARQYGGLPVERQAVEIFAHHDMGEQAGTGTALLDRQVGGPRLGDCLASPAGEFGPYMANHLQPGRNFFQHLGDVLAELDQMRAAAA
jgi:hypothetical protein